MHYCVVAGWLRYSSGRQKADGRKQQDYHTTKIKIKYTDMEATIRLNYGSNQHIISSKMQSKPWLEINK
jgi:hypothetical protein